MTDTAVIPFASGKPPQLSKAFADIGSNIPDRDKVPSLSYEGKTWTISKDGAKQKLMTMQDGEQVPLQIFKAVIIDFASKRGRTYYEGGYDPNNVQPPKCWSADGVTPDKSIQTPCAAACDKCPNSVKGSKISDNGVATTACSPHRMLAVVPSGKLDFTPLRLKIAITSDWDSQSPEMEAQGWYCFSKYLDFLKANGCPHTGAIVTKMRFDPNVAYPKLFFSADSWLTEDQQVQVAARIKTPEVQKLLDGSWTPAGVDGVETKAAAPAAEEKPAPAPTTKEEPEVVAKQEEAGEVLFMDDTPATPATAAKPKPQPESAPQASTTVADELADLLNDWTD